MGSGSRRVCSHSRHVGLVPWLAALAMLATALGHLAAAGTPSRGFVLASSSLSSASGVQRAIATATAGGYDNLVAPITFDAPPGPSFDGPAELIRLARESGLGVQLSIAVTLAAAIDELPASRDHVIYQHPEWLMVPRALAAELLTTDVRNPAYLGRLSRWSRSHTDTVAGLYVSPLDPAAVSYLVAEVVEAVRRYAADGVLLNTLEFPGPDFDYGRHAVSLFRDSVRPRLSASNRSALDEIETIDPFAYPEELPDAWRQFREAALTSLVDRLRAALVGVNPALTVAVDVRADPEAAARDHLQPWRLWLDRGLVQRIGRRSPTTSTVVFSADGSIPADPAPSSPLPASSAGGPR